MSDEETIITGIEYKVRKLIGQIQDLSQRNESIKNQNILLKETLEKQKILNRELEEKLKSLTIANLLETQKGSVEAKARINELVREIDKCIGLLNS